MLNPCLLVVFAAVSGAMLLNLGRRLRGPGATGRIVAPDTFYTTDAIDLPVLLGIRR